MPGRGWATHSLASSGTVSCSRRLKGLDTAGDIRCHPARPGQSGGGPAPKAPSLGEKRIARPKTQTQLRLWNGAAGGRDPGDRDQDQESPGRGARIPGTAPGPGAPRTGEGRKGVNRRSGPKGEVEAVGQVAAKQMAVRVREMAARTKQRQRAGEGVLR
ncbi:hypothetical protein GCM10018965_054040 [Nonomuraea roseola]